MDISDIHATRRQALASLLRDAGLDAVALNPGPSLIYLTGLPFHLSERPVIATFPADGPPSIVLPELEAGKVAGLPYELRVETYGEDPERWPDAFRRSAEGAGLASRRIGLEPRRLRVLELRLLEWAAPGAEFVAADAVLARLRMFKDEAEISTMRRAVGIAQRALQETLPRLVSGVTEREIAAEITVQMLRGGSESELPFSPIVAFGAESANPHAVPSDRPLKDGDIVLIDWGANVEGYFSDLTRCFVFGTPDPQLAEVARVVGRANEAARAEARPGVTASAVDRAARQVIEEAGYGKYFTHRTGHGLGLEIHEEPYIRGDNAQVLEAGMTFTIEPGIYLPGRGGIRIEDDVVITDDGAESLSDLDRDLRILSI